jgi:hypothetical protein
VVIRFSIYNRSAREPPPRLCALEIKTGNSQLSSNERSLRDAIQEKRIRWHEYRVDHGISDMPAPSDQEQPIAP